MSNDAALALFREGVEPCPGCSEQITFRKSSDGLSVEVLHPQPPCEGFRAFCERLIATADAAPISRKQRLQQQRRARTQGYRKHIEAPDSAHPFGYGYAYCKGPLRASEYSFSSVSLNSFELDPLACKNCLRELRSERKRQPTLPGDFAELRQAVRNGPR